MRLGEKVLLGVTFLLVSLSIKNFAIIDDISMDFTEGLNVITGETGAGKSIIIDALELAVGGRASGEYIRIGEKKAFVQAVFDVANLPRIEDYLLSRGIDITEDKLLIMNRELARSGRNLCRINNQVVTLGVFRAVGENLVDMHGQHEQQSLLSRRRQQELLDGFGGESLLQMREMVARLYREWYAKKSELEKLETNARERARRLDMLEYQVREIDGAALQEEEEEDLLRERNFLVNAEKIASLAAEAHGLLYESTAGKNAAVDLMGRAVEVLEALCSLDTSMQPVKQSLENALYQVEDAARELNDYHEKIEFDPERLAVLEDRLELIKKLKYKYGDSVAEILRYREEAAAELENLKNYEERTQELQAGVEAAREEWEKAAKKLSKLREKAAQRIEKAVAGELKDLEMSGVKFKVLLEKNEKPSENGMELVEFFISTNPGEPVRPLAKIASGGELSRVILAVKALLASVDRVPTLVFDEVDTGVGGRALQSIAEKMAEIAAVRQVISITHAAQVASFARTHYCINKKAQKHSTKVLINRLEEEKRLDELARMLGGKEVGGMARKYARQMLERAQNAQREG